MIIIKSHDTIIDILNKISESNSKKIILQFSFWHPVLHNYLSLKLIQIRVGKKELSIVSNDKASRKIWKLLWIQYKKSSFESEEKDDKNVLKENYTFFQYALFELKKYTTSLSNFFKSNKEINSIKYTRTKHLYKNIYILSWIIFISISIVFILIYIYYFAINKTFIEITPEISIKTKSRNYIYKERSDSIIEEEKYKPNQVPLEKISKLVNIQHVFQSTGFKDNGSNMSKWIILLKNLFPEEVSLKKWTLFVNQEWVQFIIKEHVTIPASTTDSSGKIIAWEIKHTAYGHTALSSWEYSGIKTNIKSGVTLTIPKLWEDRFKIFARSESSFSWAKEDISRIVTQKDIDNAKKVITELAKQRAIKEIEAVISERNKNNNSRISLLPIEDIYKFSDISIKINENLQVWNVQDTFSLKASIMAQSYTYNVDSVISKLSQIVDKSNIQFTEKIESINLKSLRISHIIKRNDTKKEKDNTLNQLIDTPLEIKATTEIEYYVSRNFEDDKNYLHNKIKFSILWMPKKEAEKMLLNMPEINNIKIKISPFFLKNISKISDNVTIKIVD